jgi:methylmalonyl-CoA mutase cobalamin-binding subunit
MYLANSPDASDPLLVSTTPLGQQHEFGALMAAVTAASGGWKTLYLGPNLPAEDIAAAVKGRRANAVVLSLVYPADDPQLETELVKLRELTDEDLPLLVGGRAAIAYDDVLTEVGAIRIGGLADLRRELDRLKPGVRLQSSR